MSSIQRAHGGIFPDRLPRFNVPAELGISNRFIVLFWIIHIPLGPALYSLGPISLIHPAIVFLVGMYWAVRTSSPMHKVALCVTYLVTTEVLWRMAKTPVFWEFGKYGSVVIIIVALAMRGAKRKPFLPLLYFLALVPSCLLTLAEYNLFDARGHLSFNMSGPLSLTAFCLLFANTRMTPKQIMNLLLVGMAPVISIATSTLFYTISAEEITFTTESNFATSGGFGPNQVSSILGIGVFFAVAVLVLFKEQNRLQKILVAALAIFFAMQSVMTFSRSGIYNVIGALLVMLLFHFQNFVDGIKRIVPPLLLAGIFLLLVFPALDKFTGGKLQERFEETGTTNRMEIIESDFAIFADNPVLGVGVGLSRRIRREYAGFSAASHTEFSRIISEHGAFGLMALLCLLAAVFVNFRRQTSILGRAFVAGFAAWSSLYMLNAGMRLAAPGFAIGITFLTIVYPRFPKVRRFAFPRRQPPPITLEERSASD
ncbi:MAG TPA: O-antigen ligase family protein [Pyrinomonadaceae bacterium]